MFDDLVPEGWLVQEADLPIGVLGLCDFDSRTIWLRIDIHHVQRRCTLMHELVHAERGRPAQNARAKSREERLVEHTAAKRLIPLPALAGALQATRETQVLAGELEVDEPILAARVEALSPLERTFLERIVEQLED